MGTVHLGSFVWENTTLSWPWIDHDWCDHCSRSCLFCQILKGQSGKGSFGAEQRRVYD